MGVLVCMTFIPRPLKWLFASGRNIRTVQMLAVMSQTPTSALSDITQHITRVYKHRGTPVRVMLFARVSHE